MRITCPTGFLLGATRTCSGEITAIPTANVQSVLDYLNSSAQLTHLLLLVLEKIERGAPRAVVSILQVRDEASISARTA